MRDRGMIGHYNSSVNSVVGINSGKMWKLKERQRRTQLQKRDIYENRGFTTNSKT